MNKLHIDEIKIPKRYRVDYGDIESLAKSICLNSLFNPIILTQNYDLNQGGRRLSALRLIYEVNKLEEDELEELDETAIYIFREHCKDEELKRGELHEGKHFSIREFEDRHQELCLELEENLRRKDLDWKEEAALVKAIRAEKLEIAKEENEKNHVSYRELGDYLGISTAKISQELEMADALEEGDEEISGAKNRQEAINILRRRKEEAIHEELLKRKMHRFQSINANGELFNLDAIECLKGLPKGAFHHIITDPPYGIDFDKMTEGSAESEHYLEISKKDYPQFIEDFATAAHEKFNSGFFVCFCAFENWHVVADILKKVGFSVSGNPLIWFKKGSPMKNHHPDKQLTDICEFAVCAWKGIPELNKPGKSNIFAHPNYIDVKNRFHITQKPVELMEEIVETFSRPGEIIADLFMGSGATPKACIKTKRHYIGNDKSKYFPQAQSEILELEEEILAGGDN